MNSALPDPAESSAPLPVQQRAWDTRERILSAAVACLAEDGYAATTTSRIQQRSGVSRGSLLHQFPSRDDLLVAAVQHLAQARMGEVAARTTDLGPHPDGAAGEIDRAVDTLWASFSGPLFRATLELWVAAQSNPDLARTLAPLEREVGRTIRGLVAHLFGPRLSAAPSFAECTTLLVSSMRGVALTYTFEPRSAPDEPVLELWKAMARQMLLRPRGGYTATA